MIQSTATQISSMQSAGAARDASGQDASHGANPNPNSNPNFEFAMAALFQTPTSEQSRADSAQLGGLGTHVAQTQRGGATKESKDKKASTKPASDAERQAAKGLDPRLANQQPMLEAQQRLMRTADVADRAAAELRGEGDQGDQGASSEHAEFAPASAPSAINKDASTRSAAEPAPTQPRNHAAGHENAAAASDSGAKNGSMTNRAAGASAHAATQQQSGGSHQGGGESRQQGNNGAAISTTNRGAASAQAKLGVPDPSSAANAARPAATTSPSGSPTGSNTASVAGPGSLATVRDPLRAFTARPEPKAVRQADPSNLPNQVARGLAAAVRQRDGTLTLRLSPESLGDIKIVVRVESGQVSAQIDAQTDQARQLLSDTASTLRSALEAQGLVVERIEVAPAERHATMEPAAGQAPIAENRAQGGALSAPDQPPPHGFGDGAPPEHRDASGHESGSGSQGASTDAHFDAAEASADPTPLGTIDFAQVDGRWVLRVDLVA